MFSKIVALIVVLAVTTAGTGLAIAYHNGLFSSNNNPQTPLPVNLPPSNNSSSPQSNNTTSTTNNNSIQDNVIVSQVQAYFTISDSQGVNVNFSEQFPGFKMIAGNSTQANITIMNNNFFNITLSRIIINSDGFDLENVTPSFPASLASHSYKNFTLQIFAQSGMRNFNGSIQVEVLGNRTIRVSVPSVHLSEVGRNVLGNSAFFENLTSRGFISSADGKAQATFKIYNNNTFAVNVSTISSASKGFYINSTYPKTHFIVMPNESRDLLVNITISALSAGYHNSINLTLTENATMHVDITSIKIAYEFVAWTAFPSVYFDKIPSNISASDNFTVQFGLQEFCGPMDSIEITGFSSQTNGITMISESVLYPTSSFPVEVSCNSVGFSVTFHVTGSMAGYHGQLDIYATD